MEITEDQRLHLLSEITGAQLALVRAHGEVDSAVRIARQCGVSWNDIGACFGISRQAAQQRFGG